MGRVNYGAPEPESKPAEKGGGWKSETQTNPSYAKVANPMLSPGVQFHISQSGFSNAEKIALGNVLKVFEAEDGVKTKIIDALVEMIAKMAQTGRPVTNFNLMAKSLVNSEIKRQSPRFLSTISVGN